MTDDEKIKIEPEFNRALNLWHENKSDEAIRILKKLDKEFPNQPVIVKMIGAIYFSLEDWSNCIIYSEKNVALSPKSEHTSITFFHCLWNQERFDEAFEEAKRFIKLNGFSKEYALILEELNENKSS